jgi:hypothetical protein
VQTLIPGSENCPSTRFPHAQKLTTRIRAISLGFFYTFRILFLYLSKSLKYIYLKIQYFSKSIKTLPGVLGNECIKNLNFRLYLYIILRNLTYVYYLCILSICIIYIYSIWIIYTDYLYGLSIYIIYSLYLVLYSKYYYNFPASEYLISIKLIYMYY